MTVALSRDLTPDELVAVVRENETVVLDDDAREAMAETRAVVDDIVAANDRPVYGVNTGFGDLYDVAIDPEDGRTLQRNLLHANTTVGNALPVEEVRAAMLARAAVFAAGHSGVRPLVVDRLLACLNAGLHPVVGEGGNSDDYGANARIGYVLTGEGEAFYEGERLPANEALSAAGIEPLTAEPKEGLPFMDGPGLMTGRISLAVHDARRLLTAADVAGALTFALIGKQPSAFSERVAEVRPHEGDATSARVVRETLDLETETDATVAQDPLSIRTIPQVHGSARETLGNAESVAETELGGVGDNPLVFPDGVVLSCGGFNGQHVSAAADALARALVKVGHASERRVHLYVQGRGESPPFVAGDPGLESGLVRAHYSAASLVREAGTLDSASDRNSVVSAGQEDVQSLGGIATDHLGTTVEKIRAAVAVELLCAVEVRELADVDLPAGAATVVDGLADRIDTEDRSKQIERVAELVADGTLGELLGEAGVDVP
ncbi:aromatic amino acid ammonia-lyase [Haloarculaceae archaeon H-GB2-1]|nr:aromatic amino acid ammonia-lyase [Haloarculaceae archaeon H-GB1-1]MEA5409408.1 aromatic amino acid ammonia-lyase [Haloarculaceae archaeon H-GB2-1]